LASFFWFCSLWWDWGRRSHQQILKRACVLGTFLSWPPSLIYTDSRGELALATVYSTIQIIVWCLAGWIATSIRSKFHCRPRLILV
jgi:hypothetical protein